MSLDVKYTYLYHISNVLRFKKMLGISIKLKIKSMDEGFDLPTDIERFNADTFEWSSDADDIFTTLFNDVFNESFSDETVANAFVSLVGSNIRTINDDGDGYVWNDGNKLWNKETAKKIMNKMIALDVYYEKIVNSLKSSCEKADNADLKKYYYQLYKNFLTSRRSLKSATGRKNAYFIASTKLFDPDFEDIVNTKHYLFPTQNNKIIDLKTGIERERTKEDLFSFERPVSLIKNPNYANVNRYMNSVFCGQTELVMYMKELFGTFLTGEILKEIYIWYGEGDNAKTTTYDIISNIMGTGQMCNAVNKSIFVDNKKSHKASGASHTSHLIPLINMRLVVCNEIKKTDEFNNTMLKEASGGDPIPYRKPFAVEEQTFQCVASLLLMTNPKPVLDVEDKALIARLRYISFGAKFVAEPDPKKKNEFLADKDFIDLMKTPDELNNFFTYMVDGAVKFYARGRKLIPPSIVLDNKKDSLNDADLVKRFIDDTYVAKYNLASDKTNRKDWGIMLSELNNKFDQWLKDNEPNQDRSNYQLGPRFVKLGLTRHKTTRGIMIIGLKLPDDEDEDDD